MNLISYYRRWSDQVDRLSMRTKARLKGLLLVISGSTALGLFYAIANGFDGEVDGIDEPGLILGLFIGGVALLLHGLKHLLRP
jgi:hypothetical protein